MNPSKTAAYSKPAKPYSDFPLFPHATGRWAKKIRGKLHYFGPWKDAEAALKRYLDQRDDLYAGRTPRNPADGLTVRDLCNRFLTSKRHLLDTREITERTFYGYHSTCGQLIEVFSRERLVDDLASADFERLRTALAKTRGPVALGNEVQRVRSVFRFAYESGLLEKPMRYGPTFKKPAKKVIRKARADHAAKHGKRMFEAADLKKIIGAASQPLRAMILLAINGGLGQSDLSNLPQTAVDLKLGWVDYPRPKTGIARRFPLWPETADVIREAIACRPKPKDAADEALLFVTRFGQRYVKLNKNGTPADALGQEFAKLLTTLGLKRAGVSFYALRHTFETVGGNSRDQVAVDSIMGHAPSDDDMSSHYRESISDERLRAVTEVVRQWLFAAPLQE